jgi:hypothetical protein
MGLKPKKTRMEKPENRSFKNLPSVGFWFFENGPVLDLVLVSRRALIYIYIAENIFFPSGQNHLKTIIIGIFAFGRLLH